MVTAAEANEWQETMLTIDRNIWSNDSVDLEVICADLGLLISFFSNLGNFKQL
jgi:hypothetical protein